MIEFVFFESLNKLEKIFDVKYKFYCEKIRRNLYSVVMRRFRRNDVVFLNNEESFNKYEKLKGKLRNIFKGDSKNHPWMVWHSNTLVTPTVHSLKKNPLRHDFAS